MIYVMLKALGHKLKDYVSGMIYRVGYKENY